MAGKIETSKLSDLALGKLPPDEALRLMEELESNAEASRELDRLIALTNFAAEHGAEIQAERARAHAGGMLEKVRDWVGTQFREPAIRYGFTAMLVVALGGGAVVTSRYVAGPYEDLARITNEVPDYTVRGPGDQDLAIASELIAHGDYAGSVRLCERYLRIHPDGESVSNASYVAGVASLLAARHTVLSLFPSYDRDQAKKGIEFLTRAADLSPSRRLREDALWVRAKGFLMLRMPAEAGNDLNSVIELHGPRSEEASALLLKIREADRK